MPPRITHRNRVVRVDQTPVIEAAIAESHLESDQAAASSTITVANTERFAVGNFVWINPFSEKSEIVAVHASTAPVQATGVITLAANTVYAHNAGEKVYYVDFDRVEVNHAPTEGGSKSLLATLNLAAGEKEIRYTDTSKTSGFYSARYNDSVAADFGSYSDEVPYDGWSINEVGHFIDRSLRDLGLSLSEGITIDDCLEWITEGLRFTQGKQLRWPEHISYNAVIGQAIRGQLTTTMPTDAYDRETNKSVIGLRVGDGKNLRYLDPVTFDAQLEGVKYTQVRTQAAVGATSLAVDNSYDFDDGSAANPATLHAYISGSLDSFTYTGVTRDDVDGGTAAFTGIPASGDDSIENILTVDTYIWQDEDEGVPEIYTIRNSNVEIWPLTDGSEDNANIYMDYALVATTVDSETDVIDFQRADMILDYLRWRMWCKNKNNGELDMRNQWYVQFKEKLNDAIRTIPPSNKFRMKPLLNRMQKRGGRTADLQGLDISEQ